MMNPNQLWHQAPQGNFRAGESQQQQLLCSGTCWLRMSPEIWTCVCELLRSTLLLYCWEPFTRLKALCWWCECIYTEVPCRLLTYFRFQNRILTFSVQHQTLQLNIAIWYFTQVKSNLFTLHIYFKNTTPLWHAAFLQAWKSQRILRWTTRW